MTTLADQQTFTTMVARLSRLSVDKHFDAYADVDWDAPDMALDPADPRLELPPFDPLARTEWYRSQPPEVRARIGLYRYGACMKIGWHFENLLQRGLLGYASRLPNGALEFRYAHHELIEESQHTLMFQEFVNRSGLPIEGLGRGMRAIAPLVVPLGRWFPGLFFFFVLGGEDPIDHVQRQTLARGTELHPLVERIIRIHVAEEARHLSFARHYLRRRIPRLGWIRRQIIGIAIPIILGVMARMMLAPSRAMIRHFQIPRSVVDEAYRHDPIARATTQDSLAKVRNLATELRLVNRVNWLIWKAFKIWPSAAEPA